MSFVWDPVAGVASTELLVEIKDNVDTTISAMGATVPAFSWLEPAFVGVASALKAQDLRDGVDYADDQNYCRSNLAADLASENVGQCSGQDGTQYSGVLGSHNSGVNGACGTYYANAVTTDRSHNSSGG